MKKLLLISMIAAATMGSIGCGEDDGTVADVRWTNSATSGDYVGAIHEIAWTGSKDVQMWNESIASPLNTGETNDFKGVKDLTGEGSCIGSGLEDLTIKIEADPDGGAYTISENAAETLVIETMISK